jgi:hypothetical protein
MATKSAKDIKVGDRVKLEGSFRKVTAVKASRGWVCVTSNKSEFVTYDPDEPVTVK